MTVYEKIMKHLTDNGIDAWPPAKKTGDCTSPYTVVKDDGSNQISGYSSTMTYYTLLCYVPASKFSSLETYVSQVEDVMKLLQPMVMPTYFKTPSFYDDTVKAHMISVRFKNNKKIAF